MNEKMMIYTSDRIEMDLNVCCDGNEFSFSLEARSFETNLHTATVPFKIVRVMQF